MEHQKKITGLISLASYLFSVIFIAIGFFVGLHDSTKDLKNKVKMQRLLGQKTCSCFQRCVGMDAFNAPDFLLLSRIRIPFVLYHYRKAH